MIGKKTILEVLSKSDFWGFTNYLRGGEFRYVVAFTHFEFEEGETIEEVSDKLANFVEGLSKEMKSLTIGWWKNPEDERLYIDFWIATDDRDFAIWLGRTFSQISIWDNSTCDTINL